MPAQDPRDVCPVFMACLPSAENRLARRTEALGSLLSCMKQDAPIRVPNLTDEILGNLAERASVDKRTAMRWLLGLPVRLMAKERLEQARQTLFSEAVARDGYESLPILVHLSLSPRPQLLTRWCGSQGSPGLAMAQDRS